MSSDRPNPSPTRPAPASGAPSLVWVAGLAGVVAFLLLFLAISF